MHPIHTHQAGIPQTGTKARFQVQGDYEDLERCPHQGLSSLTLPPGATAGGGALQGRGRWAFPVVPSRRAGWESLPHSFERKPPVARLLRNWGDVTAGGSREAGRGPGSAGSGTPRAARAPPRPSPASPRGSSRGCARTPSTAPGARGCSAGGRGPGALRVRWRGPPRRGRAGGRGRARDFVILLDLLSDSGGRRLMWGTMG